MSEGAGLRQSARLFLEGREVPFVSASIQSQVGEPCTASIDVVPLQKIKFVRPKTQVHLFVQDVHTFGNADFYLAFEGEVTGRGYGKRQDNRSTRLMAMDYSSYWEDAKSYFMNAAFAVSKAADTINNGEPTPRQVAKALAGKITPTDTTAESFMIQILTSKKDADGKVDLVAGVVEVFKRLSIVNEFYRAAYERLRIADRMRAYSFSKLGTFLEAIRTDIFFASFEGANGGLESVRSLMSKVFSFVFHEIVSLPFPGKALNTGGGTSFAQFLFIPDSYTLPPPKCNVLFPNQIIGTNFDDDFRSQPTRYMFRPAFILPAKDGVKQMTYPAYYFPTSFSDYMFRKKTVTTAEGQSLLGPSSILKSADGHTYANIQYGGKKDTSVGTSAHPVLREADFLTNDESIRGIFLATDTFSPNYSALVKSAGEEARTAFFRPLGAYLYFKKRFGARQCSADILFNPNIALGFNALFLDDGDAGQSFIAKVQSITHIITNSGFATQLGIAYGRDFDEIDMLSGGIGEPPVPPWLDPDVFGSNSAADYQAETDFLNKREVLSEDEKMYRKRLLAGFPAEKGRPKRDGQNPVSYKNLSKFYKSLIGVEAITGFTGNGNAAVSLATTRGAVDYLLDAFNKASTRPGGQEAFVQKYTKRLFITMAEAFDYLGASTNDSDAKGVPFIPPEFAKFEADASVTGKLKGRFDGTGFSDQDILKVRREIIDAYIELLKSKRNFRG